ncbi:MAG: arsenosugar biosynthesis radical SAM (seleno)protein ArsS [Sulfuricaulis sp.]
MHATLPLLKETDFPVLRRRRLETLQVNLGYRCNQACLHCHVNASPDRKEQMSPQTVHQVLTWLATSGVPNLDITGGAPELHLQFRHLVYEARRLNVHVIDRCNLTVLGVPGHEDLAAFLAEQQVEVVASLPCYLQENVDGQRGQGVYQSSIDALLKLNALGYGKPHTGLVLKLVYNPTGPFLPPAQETLELDYRRELFSRFGIEFNQLYTLANMPINRFGSNLISRGKFEAYMGQLKSAHRDENLESVMCRSLISVDWLGYVYDCDFNQMLGLPLIGSERRKMHISELTERDLEDNPIAVADHCYGCTAGQGSGCGGALR